VSVKTKMTMLILIMMVMMLQCFFRLTKLKR